jgi:hypothetical protein
MNGWGAWSDGQLASKWWLEVGLRHAQPCLTRAASSVEDWLALASFADSVRFLDRTWLRTDGAAVDGLLSRLASPEDEVLACVDGHALARDLLALLALDAAPAADRFAWARWFEAQPDSPLRRWSARDGVLFPTGLAPAQGAVVRLAALLGGHAGCAATVCFERGWGW